MGQEGMGYKKREWDERIRDEEEKHFSFINTNTKQIKAIYLYL